MPQIKKTPKGRKLGKAPLFSPFSTPTERPKRGRPTIQDNFLLGARNAWISLLEETWPEIGWHLLCIRDRRKSTIENIRKAFEPVKAKPHNPGLAAAFYRESSESATPADIRRNRKHLSELDGEINQTEAKYREQQRSCQEADAALKMASPSEIGTIQDEGTRRLKGLLQLEDELKRLFLERDALYMKTQDQEAFAYRSELLDFLHSRRYAINPRKLANALAGLPLMKWRQSFVRCSGITFDLEARREYRVFEVFSSICSRQSDRLKDPPLELFRAELLRLPKKLGYTRQFLWDNWHDLRAAIDECWKSEHAPASIPFVLTSLFIRNVMRQKNPAERILADRDKLEA